MSGKISTSFTLEYLLLLQLLLAYLHVSVFVIVFWIINLDKFITRKPMPLWVAWPAVKHLVSAALVESVWITLKLCKMIGSFNMKSKKKSGLIDFKKNRHLILFKVQVVIIKRNINQWVKNDYLRMLELTLKLFILWILVQNLP